jgi:hypothetical protein
VSEAISHPASGGQRPSNSPRNAHNFEREPLDHYVEPFSVSKALFADETFGALKATILDPACGWGRVLLAAAAAGFSPIGSDIVDRRGGDPNGDPNGVSYELPCIPFHTCDFLVRTPIQRPWAIVTNPPYDLIEEFAERALKIAVHKVALFVPLRRLPAARWLQRMPLESVLMLTPRPSVPTGEHITNGGKVGGGEQDFAWLVFNRLATVTVPQLRWLPHDNDIAKRNGKRNGGRTS